MVDLIKFEIPPQKNGESGSYLKILKIHEMKNIIIKDVIIKFILTLM